MSDTVIEVMIEIPAGSSIKYEQDEENGRIYVDRFVPTPMAYPENYGLIEGAKGKDGDLLDALLLTVQPVMPGSWMKARVIGMLEMEDEEGIDHKLICVPAKAKQDYVCGGWEDLSDVPQYRLDRIKHFFEHYKDLEKDKWVKINKFVGKAEALKELQEAMSKAA
ncbi:inorganic diphosphatase [Patescibacteria group bacterium]|nr:inorganic diphosphatase [Patescibacteria group bacterium]